MDKRLGVSIFAGARVIPAEATFTPIPAIPAVEHILARSGFQDNAAQPVSALLAQEPIAPVVA